MDIILTRSQVDVLRSSILQDLIAYLLPLKPLMNVSVVVGEDKKTKCEPRSRTPGSFGIYSLVCRVNNSCWLHARSKNKRNRSFQKRTVPSVFKTSVYCSLQITGSIPLRSGSWFQTALPCFAAVCTGHGCGSGCGRPIWCGSKYRR